MVGGVVGGYVEDVVEDGYGYGVEDGVENKGRNRSVEMLKDKQGKNVLIRYPGGAIYIALLNHVGPTELNLKNPVWVADTGRLGLFFKGQFDSNCQWETMGEDTDVPRAHAEVSLWPHPVPTESR